MDTRVYVGRMKQDFWPLNMVSSASREAPSVLTSLPRLLITLPTHNAVALRYSCPCSLLRSCGRTCRYFLVKRKDRSCDRTLQGESVQDLARDRVFTIRASCFHRHHDSERFVSRARFRYRGLVAGLVNSSLLGGRTGLATRLCEQTLYTVIVAALAFVPCFHSSSRPLLAFVFLS